MVVEEEMTRHLLTLTHVNLKFFIIMIIGVPQYHQLLPSLESLVVTIHPTTLKLIIKLEQLIFSVYHAHIPRSLLRY